MEDNKCDQSTHVSPELTWKCTLCGALICSSCCKHHTSLHINRQQPVQRVQGEPPQYSSNAYGDAATSTPDQGKTAPNSEQASYPALSSTSDIAQAEVVSESTGGPRKRDKWKKAAKGLYEKDWVRRSLKAGGVVTGAVVVGVLLGESASMGENVSMGSGIVYTTTNSTLPGALPQGDDGSGRDTST